MTSNENTRGRTIRMFLVDGSASGIVTAEIINWTGKVLVAPRSRLPDLFRQAEVSRTGVYILTGDDQDEPQRTLAYIGESDDIRSRLTTHNNDDRMEFFNRVCVVVSKDENLTKAHVRYLESHLLRRAREANRAKLVNAAEPDFDLLPVSDKADMEYFLEQVELILPALGFELFKAVGVPQRGTDDWISSSAPSSSVGQAVTHTQPIPRTESSEVQYFELVKPYVRATAYEVDGEFVVQQGSLARRGHDGDGWEGYQRRRDQLVADGLLVPAANADHFEFTKDVPLRSPSEAACIVLAQSANGRKQWVVRNTSKTYNEWLAELLAASRVTSDS